MADKTVTVGSGLDYATINAALVFESGGSGTPDLVANTRILTVSVEGSWSSADVTNVTALTGFTTDSSYYVRIVTNATARHDGTAHGTNKYRLEPTGSSHCIVLDQEYTRIEGLVIKLKDDPANSSEGIRCDVGSNNSTIDKNIIWHNDNDTDADGIYLWNSSSHDDNHVISASNNIIYGFTRAGFNCQSYVNNAKNSTINLRSNTIWDCGSSGEGESSAIHLRSSSPASGTVTCNAYNNIGSDVPVNTDFFVTGPTGSGTITWTGDYNACTTAAGPMPGGNSLASHTVTDSTTPGAGDWIIITSDPSMTKHPYGANVDLHLIDDADNDMIDAGQFSTIPASPYAEDIDGDTRSDPPEIGADEISGAAPPAAFIPRMTMF